MDAPYLLPTLQQVSHHQMWSLTWTNQLPKLVSLLCNLPSLCYCVISNREQTKAERIIASCYMQKSLDFIPSHEVWGGEVQVGRRGAVFWWGM